MILNIYSIFDNKAAVFNAPFFMNHDGLALRAASDLVNDPATTVHRHPADFNLMKIGQFDDATGNILPCIPENLATMASLVKATTQGVLFNG